MKCCKNCKYSQKYQTLTYLECRRYPPSLVYSTIRSISEWPKVEEYQWCGEFKNIKDDNK